MVASMDESFESDDVATVRVMWMDEFGRTSNETNRQRRMDGNNGRAKGHTGLRVCTCHLAKADPAHTWLGTYVCIAPRDGWVVQGGAGTGTCFFLYLKHPGSVLCLNRLRIKRVNGLLSVLLTICCTVGWCLGGGGFSGRDAATCLPKILPNGMYYIGTSGQDISFHHTLFSGCRAGCDTVNIYCGGYLE